MHEIVRRFSACAPVCYLDNDPLVISHMHALAAMDDDRKGQARIAAGRGRR